jgi:hypothetical protein
MTATTKTTFPIVGTERGETIRRNAETGVEIRGTRMDNGKSEYTVYAPGRDKMRLINYYESLAGAREEASDRAQEIRDLRDAAHSDAITENAERAIAEHCPELLAVDTDPEIAAEVAEANGLDPEDATELTEYARKQFPSVAAMLDGSKEAPAERVERLGFRVRPNGIGTLWTHTLTGVMIGKFPGEPYAVTVPVKGAHVEVVAGFDEFPTFEAALDHAMTLVVRWTRRIQDDAEAALVEHFERFPLVADKSHVYYEGRVREVYAVGHVLLLSARSEDPDVAIRVAAEAVFPVSKPPAPKRELPTQVVRHASVVTFADSATVKPEPVPGATAVSPWKIDGTDTVNRAPGGRIYVHVWQSYTDPEKGFSTRLMAAWLDELRTEGGAARVTLPGFPRS